MSETCQWVAIACLGLAQLLGGLVQLRILRGNVERATMSRVWADLVNRLDKRIEELEKAAPAEQGE